MTDTVSTPVNIIAGSTAVGVSVGSSLGTSSSLYRASWEQIANGQYELILSDVLGLISMSVLLINVGINVWRWRRDTKRKARRKKPCQPD